jgi:thioredoxin reductase
LALGSSLFPFFGVDTTSVAPLYLFQKINTPKKLYDAIIVGGSYAGLSAALTLARCLRNVLVIDAGKPRNRFAKQAHNAIMIEGRSPAEIRETVSHQFESYRAYLDMLSGEAVDVYPSEGKFFVKVSTVETTAAPYLIFATGASDLLPDIRGIEEQWGKNVHHCPYCHGFESKKGRTMLLVQSFRSLELLPSLKHWCENLVVCFQGEANIPQQLVEMLKKNHISWNQKKVVELKALGNGSLKEALYTDGSRELVDHVYLKPQTVYQTDLAEKLGCQKDKTNRLITDEWMLSTQPNIYAVGDISSKSLEQIIWAANSGMTAGVSINSQMVSAQFKF